jgi:hypothetical protein
VFPASRTSTIAFAYPVTTDRNMANPASRANPFSRSVAPVELRFCEYRHHRGVVECAAHESGKGSRKES